MLNCTTVLEEARRDAGRIAEDRRWLHAHAETGFDLAETLPWVRARLEEMGYAPRPLGRAGLSVDVGGKRPGKTFLLRADMDALPIQEESGVDFSCAAGRMHACGHDLHTAMLLEAARILKAHEDEITGTVRLMFQPAEEIFEGSRDMIGAGILEGVDAAMMIHVMAGVPLPAGSVIVSPPGVSAPAADYFTVTVQGQGCHGSAPQDGVDPLSAAAHIVVALQELHARELSPNARAVLTVGTFHAGAAANAIPDTAVLGGSIRTYDEKTRAQLKQRLTEISQGTAAVFRASASVEFGSGCPTLVNNADLVRDAEKYTAELLGPERALSGQKMAASGGLSGGGSEDFAYVSQEVPSVMLALAAGEPAKGYPYPQHHPKVKFDEGALPTGSAILTCCALRWLEEHP